MALDHYIEEAKRQIAESRRDGFLSSGCRPATRYDDDMARLLAEMARSHDRRERVTA